MSAFWETWLGASGATPRSKTLRGTSTWLKNMFRPYDNRKHGFCFRRDDKGKTWVAYTNICTEWGPFAQHVLLPSTVSKSFFLCWILLGLSVGVCIFVGQTKRARSAYWPIYRECPKLQIPCTSASKVLRNSVVHVHHNAVQRTILAARNTYSANDSNAHNSLLKNVICPVALNNAVRSAWIVWCTSADQTFVLDRSLNVDTPLILLLAAMIGQATALWWSWTRGFLLTPLGIDLTLRRRFLKYPWKFRLPCWFSSLCMYRFSFLPPLIPVFYCVQRVSLSYPTLYPEAFGPYCRIKKGWYLNASKIAVITSSTCMPPF